MRSTLHISHHQLRSAATLFYGSGQIPDSKGTLTGSLLHSASPIQRHSYITANLSAVAPPLPLILILILILTVRVVPIGLGSHHPSSSPPLRPYA
jgi:hypothetical protein